MRHRALLTSLSLVLVSCGGGDGGGALPLGERSFEDVVSAADTLASRFGGQGGFFVSVIALDLGYSGEQVVAGAAAVQADGSIPGVEPDHQLWGLVEPLEAPQAMGMAVSGRSAAPRGLAAQQDQPKDSLVSFLGATASEIMGAAEAKIEREQIYQDSVRPGSDRSLPVIAILSLALTGYSLDQILEALLFDQWTRFGVKGCTVIDDGTGIVTPRNQTGYAQTSCRTDSGGSLFGAITTTTTTTEVLIDDDTGPIDGTYTGTVDLLIQIPTYEILESQVMAVIADGAVEMSVSYVLRWGARGTNDVTDCTVTVRATLAGTGSVAGTAVRVPLAGVSLDILEAVGSSCDVVESDGTVYESVMADWAEDTALPILFTGDFVSGALVGSFTEGIFGVTATK